MEEQTPAPAEQVEEPIIVDNPEAVVKKNQELLAELKRLKAVAKQAEGFDFDKARAAMDALAKAEEEKLSKRGEYEKLLAQKQQAYEERVAAAQSERDQILANLKREKLANVLAENGVLPDRAKYLVKEIEDQIELVTGETGFSLTKKGGIGDAAEFAAMIQNIRLQSPFFFAANTPSGSGAPGSQHTPQGKTITRAEYDAAPTRFAGQLAKGELTITD